jgi:UDP-N-acetylglucosamine--N-acetylmuramyl-(pentapeptide) pyrophosphoryl-undecaprenol N-acetylglucosamine transferase
MVEIVFTGGGSGGHTSAAIGMIDALRDAAYPSDKILWIGSSGGIESGVAARNGISFESISVGKLRRYWDSENLLDIPRVLKGIFQSVKLLRAMRPKLVVSMGGFVSVPVVLAARLSSLPVLVHEQTLVPGIANRIGGRVAGSVVLTFPESSAYFGHKECITIGNPLRKELRRPLRKREEALARLELDPDLPLLYVTGGAQGASSLNRIVGEILPELVESWQIIHQFGTLTSEFSKDYLREAASSLPAQLANRYRMLSYIEDGIFDIYSAASLMLSRSGAGTVNEIRRLGIPAILVPLPNSAENEQQKMAEKLETLGAAIVFSESDLASQDVLRCLQSLTDETLAGMSQKARSDESPFVEERLAELILTKLRASN